MNRNNDKAKQLGLKFKQIHETFEVIANQQLKQFDITISQIEILNFLFNKQEKNVTQKEVEKYFDLSHPTIVGLIKRMEEKGFVKTMTDLDDKRCKLICLTEKAYKIENILKIHLESMNNKLIKGLNEEQILKLNEIIDIILSNMNYS